MRHGRIFLDSFTGAAADLKKGARSNENVLAALASHPRVSTWDMGEHAWLCGSINDLKKSGFIVERDEPFPWHRFALTDAGREAIAQSTGGAEAFATKDRPDEDITGGLAG